MPHQITSQTGCKHLSPAHLTSLRTRSYFDCARGEYGLCIILIEISI